MALYFWEQMITIIKELNLTYWIKLFNNIIQNFKILNYSIIIAQR